MSGFAGIFHLDGLQATRAEVAGMALTMLHRRPEGIVYRCRGPVGLGQLRRHSNRNPSSSRPASDLADRFSIVADVRLDNRDHLLGRLNLNDSAAPSLADSQLILAAYEKWGRACPEQLEGAFAFAVWDSRHRQIFCARDAAGVKPFYYAYDAGHFFAFGSEQKALLSCEKVSHELDPERLGDFFASICSNDEYTFFHDIRRLPPAHSLTVDAKGRRLHRYWSLDPDYALHLESDEAYAEAFLEHFREAVRCRFRSPKPVGAYLSGGLDSSSIACVASRVLAAERENPLPTLSAVYDDYPECDERVYIDAVLQAHSMRPTFVEASEQRPITAIEELLPLQDEPFQMPNAAATLQRCQAAARLGLGTVLDGHGGDEVVSHGTYRARELAQAGRWLALPRELHGLARLNQEPFLPLLWQYVQEYGLQPLSSRYDALRLPRRAWSAAKRRLAGTNGSSPERQPILSEGFLEEIDLQERYRAAIRNGPSSAESQREHHYLTLTDPQQPLALELLDRCSAAFELETRYPFWDRRLVSFCLSAPADQKLDKGWTRFLLRRSMRDYLPDKVRWRRDKADFTATLLDGLLIRDRDKLDDIMHDRLRAAEPFVNAAAARRLHARLISDDHDATLRELSMMLRIVTFTLWMENRGERPQNSETLVRRKSLA